MNRNKLITVRFTKSEFKIIEQLAASRGKSVSNTIRELSLSHKDQIDKKEQVVAGLMVKFDGKLERLMKETADIKQTLREKGRESRDKR